MTTETRITQVSPANLLACLQACVKAKRPAFTWGSPGTAKSDLHRQLAASLNAELIDLRASQWDAVDTRGIPYLSESNGTRWAVPEIFPTAERAAAAELIIIFLDELNSAAPSVQAALYQLILDRCLGEYVLPDNVMILAAGNLETDRAVTHRMSSALANRFCHFQLLVDNSSWERWALSNDIHVACIAYNRWRPDNLHSWDAKSSSKAQATPRSWEYASDLLKVIEADGINGQVEAALITGTLGDAVGTELLGFLKIYRNLQDPDAIIMNPNAADVSEDPAINWALCGALAERASESNIDRIVQYAERLDTEFMTLLLRGAALKSPAIQQTKAFIQWASNHADVLI